jgi:hypothetical protein
LLAACLASRNRELIRQRLRPSRHTRSAGAADTLAVVGAEDRMITQQQIERDLGKSIAQICPNGFAGVNQSAHFVAHVLDLRLGVTCQIMGHGRFPGVSVRVEDIFSRCPSAGVWSLRPGAMSTCLVFVTRASSVSLAAKVMASAPHAHMGLFVNGLIWHHSDSQRKVVRHTPGELVAHYPGQSMFYGSLP